MIVTPTDESLTFAHRELARQSMEMACERLDWLQDASRVPASSTTDYGSRREESLAAWMTTQFAVAAQTAHSMLDYEKVFEKYSIGKELQSLLENAQIDLEMLKDSFLPGFRAMSDIIGAVPQVAHRAEIDRKEWRDVAEKSRTTGKKLAFDNTWVQLFVRGYLSLDVRNGGLDTSKLKIDSNGGLTTVTPLADLIVFATRANRTHNNIFLPTKRPCLALDSRVDKLNSRSVFDAAWDVFAHVADREIFGDSKSIRNISEEGQPDPFAVITIGILAIKRFNPFSLVPIEGDFELLDQ